MGSSSRGQELSWLGERCPVPGCAGSTGRWLNTILGNAGLACYEHARGSPRSSGARGRPALVPLAL